MKLESFKGLSKVERIEALKKRKLPVSGNMAALERRYEEFLKRSNGTETESEAEESEESETDDCSDALEIFFGKEVFPTTMALLEELEYPATHLNPRADEPKDIAEIFRPISTLIEVRLSTLSGRTERRGS